MIMLCGLSIIKEVLEEGKSGGGEEGKSGRVEEGESGRGGDWGMEKSS